MPDPAAREDAPDSMPVPDPIRLDGGRLLSAVLEVIDALIVVLDPEGRIVVFGRACERTTGYTLDEVRGRPIWDFLLPEDQRDLVRLVFADLRSGKQPNRHENDWVTKSGLRRRIAWSNTCLTDEQGEVRFVIGTGVDITRLRRTERSAAEEEARTRAIIENAVDGIITIDRAGVIESFNPAAERLFGYTAEEAIGQNVTLLMPEPYRSEHDTYLDNYRQTHRRKIIGIGREVVGRKKNGTVFPIHLAVSEVLGGSHPTYAGIIRDLSDVHRLQQQVVHSQRLAAVGEMAASVAHEIKNPLAGISGVVQVLRDSTPAEDPRRGLMTEVLGQVERLDHTVRQFLLLAKPWRADAQECDLRDIIRRVSALVTDHPVFAEVQIEFPEETPMLAWVDPTLVEQLLWNVYLNAAQAMRKGGVIRHEYRVTEGVTQLAVADDGPGIPVEARERVFTPFFTTKTEGVGLGLSICKSIMEAHGGTVSIENAPARGAIIRMSFPKRP